MKGYVKNIGKAPIYIFKGVVNSNETITFDTLLRRFGDVADTSSEKVFADWLSKNKFIDKSRWQIITKKPVKKSVSKPEVKETPAVELPSDEIKIKLEKVESADETKVKLEKVEPKKVEPVSKVTATNKEIIRQSVTGVKKEMTIDYIVNIKTVNMKKEVSRIDDLNLLKIALKKAEGMTKKATLCNALRDRITELSIR